MVALVFEFTSLAGSADGVLRPTQEHCDLGDIERPSPVLEHLWNRTVVRGWGSLVRIGFNGSDGP